MKKHDLNKARGFGLIEVMVAVAVLIFGLLAIVRLSVWLMEAGAHAKARTQAVQLAEAIVEEQRGQNQTFLNADQLGAVCPPHATPSTAFNCIWNYSAAIGDINVNVNWQDRSAQRQDVFLNSRIAWDDPGKIAGLWKNSGGSNAGKYAKPPTGRAILGAGGSNNIGSGGAPTVADGVGVKATLTAADGTMLLQATKPDESFGVVSGRVYIDNAKFPSLDFNDVYVSISDASYCYVNRSGADGSPGQVPSSGTIVFRFVDYRCYVGPAWYGNLSVVLTGPSVTNQVQSAEICLGTPGATITVPKSGPFNLAPIVSNLRNYRGYRPVGTGYQSTGIRENPDGGYNASPEAGQFEQQDFLITTTKKGNCSVPLGLTIAGIPNTEFANNPAKYVCLSDPNPPTNIDGGFCPTTLLGTGSETAASARVTFAITGNTTLASAIELESGDGTCDAPGDGTSVCSISLNGFAGDFWARDLRFTFTAPGILCADATGGPASGQGIMTTDVANGIVRLSDMDLSVPNVNIAVSVCPPPPAP